jgi:very-short-patch-repair endonuclease
MLDKPAKKAKLLSNAKSLRTNQTEAEQKLWFHLRAHRFMNLKFKRQKPLGRYIVDFICEEIFLILEIDGGQHAEKIEYDQHRDAWLKSQGYTVLRFWNNEVMQQFEGVMQKIYLYTLAYSPSPPAPLPQAGEGR